MYLQFTGDVPTVGDNGVDGEVKLVGDGFIGHAFHNAGYYFFFTLAECFLLVFFLFFFVGAKQLVYFSGDYFCIIADREVVIVLF